MILATRLWLTEVILCCGGVWSSVQLAGDGVVCVAGRWRDWFSLV